MIGPEYNKEPAFQFLNEEKILEQIEEEEAINDPGLPEGMEPPTERQLLTMILCTLQDIRRDMREAWK